MDIARLPALLVLLWVLFLLAPRAAAADLYVHVPTVQLRHQPGPEETIVHTLSFGDRIVVTDMPEDSPANGWIKGKADAATICVMGYVRSDNLLPVPTPDLSQTGFASLTGQLQKIGDPQIKRTDDVTIMTQAFDKGVTLQTRTFHTAYGDFEEHHLEVAAITVAQGFLLARAIVNQDGVTSDHMTRVPNVEQDAEGHRFVFDDSHWQIISVKQVPTGIVITFPERAD